MERGLPAERESDESMAFSEGVYVGEYETENYKFGFVRLAVTSTSTSHIVGFQIWDANSSLDL